MLLSLDLIWCCMLEFGYSGGGASFHFKAYHQIIRHTTYYLYRLKYIYKKINRFCSLKPFVSVGFFLSSLFLDALQAGRILTVRLSTWWLWAYCNAKILQWSDHGLLHAIPKFDTWRCAWWRLVKASSRFVGAISVAFGRWVSTRKGTRKICQILQLPSYGWQLWLD